MLTFWRKWIAAFDAAAKCGDWSKATSYLAEDVAYAVTGAPFGCEVRGRDHVIAAFEKSISNFDRKFDVRRWEAVNLKLSGDQAITALSKGDYELANRPPITFAAQSIWVFCGDKISMMVDTYDLSEIHTQETLAWLDKYGEGMDPSYV
ncbi:MAG: nuclear transport factor 2 family protein [Pseudomonadota bacterium]